MKKLIITGFLSFLGIVGFSQTTIEFSEEEHDFGAIVEGDIPTYIFKFKNLGPDSLHLSSVKPSCGCTTPHWPKDTLPAGATEEIKVQYNSKGRVPKSSVTGPFNKTINIVSNSKNELEVLRIKGVAIRKSFLDTLATVDKNDSPTISLSEKSNHFGTIEKNKPRNHKITIRNTGKDTLKILGVEAGCHCVNHTKTKAAIPAGESATIELTYYPKSIGDNKEILVIVTNDPKTPFVEYILTADVVKSLGNESILFEGGSFGF